MTAELPAGWRTRPATPDDELAIQAVVHASDIAAIGYPDYPLEEIRESLPNSWVALDPDARIVAWAYLDNPTESASDFAEVYADPERGRPAMAPLLDMLLARSAALGASRGYDMVTVRGGAVPTEEFWVGVLRAAGFEFVKRNARMTRPLTADFAAPPPPPGVTVRVATEGDLPEIHRILDTAFRDTPDYEPMSYEVWRSRYPSPTWGEWFVAEVDGAPAGILQSSDQALEHNEGWVKYLAVLREHRKRGVGGALLARAFEAYAATGRTAAGLGVDLSNPTEAYRLYTSVGLTVAYEADMLEREVLPAPASASTPA